MEASENYKKLLKEIPQDVQDEVNAEIEKINIEHEAKELVIKFICARYEWNLETTSWDESDQNDIIKTIRQVRLHLEIVIESLKKIREEIGLDESHIEHYQKLLEEIKNT